MKQDLREGKVLADEIVESLALYDELGGAFAGEDGGGAGEAVVVAGHRVVVGARGEDGQDVASLGALDQRSVNERVGLAVLAGDSRRKVSCLRCLIGDQGGVDGV